MLYFLNRLCLMIGKRIFNDIRYFYQVYDAHNLGNILIKFFNHDF